MIIARKAFNDTQAYSPSGSRSVSASPTGEAAGSSRRQRAASRSLSRPKSESYSATRKRGGSSPSSSPILAGASVADDSTVEQETAPPLSIGQSLTSRKRVDTPAYPQSPGVPSLRKNPAVEENAHQQSPSRSPSPSGGPSAASDGGRKSRASSVGTASSYHQKFMGAKAFVTFCACCFFSLLKWIQTRRLPLRKRDDE